MRKRTTTLRWALLTAVVLVFGLAACGGDNETTPPETQTGGATTTTESTKPVTLEIWSWGSPDEKVMKQLNDRYMQEHPNATIKFVVQPFNSYFTLLRSAVATRKGPDVFMNYASPFLFDYFQGLTPLADYVSDDLRDQLTGWGSVSGGLKPEGTPYGVPWLGQGIQMYYNKALFEKAGIDPAAPPTTWDELLAACDALKAANVVPIVAGWKDGYYAEWFGELFATQLLSEDQVANYYANPEWTDPAMVKGLDYVKQLVDRDCTTPNAEAIPLFPNAVDNFASGKGAMFVGLASNNAHWGEFTPKLGDDLGAMLAPLLPDSNFAEQRMNFGPALSWAIAKWGENPQEAFDYVSFLVSPESQEFLFEQAGSIPNVAGASPAVTDPVAEEILGWISDTPVWIGPFTTIRAQVEVTFDKMVPQFITGRTSIEDAMKQVQATQDKAPPIPEE